MKVETKERRDSNFKPFDLIITVESLEELNSLYARFNTNDIDQHVYNTNFDWVCLREAFLVVEEKCKELF